MDLPLSVGVACVDCGSAMSVLGDLIGSQAAIVGRLRGWGVEIVSTHPITGYVVKPGLRVEVIRWSPGHWEGITPGGHVVDFGSQWELLVWLEDLQ